MISSEEKRMKEYRAIHDAENCCDDAHYVFKRYMRAIGKVARLDWHTASHQLERDLKANIDLPTLKIGLLEPIIERGIDLAKRDPESGLPIPYASGHSYGSDEEDESFYAWSAFNIADLPSDIDVNDADLPYVLTGWAHHWNGAGRSFSNSPYTIVGRTRILVKQFKGLDI